MNRFTEYMKKIGVPVTRENYIEMAYDDDHGTLTADEEASLPEELQLLQPTDD